MMKLNDLTIGERLLLERRRNGESQCLAAMRHGVSRYRYRLWEADKDDGPIVPLRALRVYEACLVLRRRNGAHLYEIAAEAGISRWWLCQMEYGLAPPDRLVAFWVARNGALRSPQCP